LTPLRVHGRDPSLPGVVGTRIGHQQVIRLLNPHHVVIAQDLHRLSPVSFIDIEAEVMEPNLPMLTHEAGELAKAGNPPEAGQLDASTPGVPQDHLWREVVNAPLGIGVFVRPMAPELIVLDERRMLPIHQRSVGTASHIRIQHRMLDGEAPFSEVLPGMPSFDRGPADAELLETGT
jgi:hypothetical protein